MPSEHWDAAHSAGVYSAACMLRELLDGVSDGKVTHEPWPEPYEEVRRRVACLMSERAASDIALQNARRELERMRETWLRMSTLWVTRHCPGIVHAINAAGGE